MLRTITVLVLGMTLISCGSSHTSQLANEEVGLEEESEDMQLREKADFRTSPSIDLIMNKVEQSRNVVRRDENDKLVNNPIPHMKHAAQIAKDSMFAYGSRFDAQVFLAIFDCDRYEASLENLQSILQRRFEDNEKRRQTVDHLTRIQKRFINAKQKLSEIRELRKSSGNLDKILERLDKNLIGFAPDITADLASIILKDL